LKVKKNKKRKLKDQMSLFHILANPQVKQLLMVLI